MTTLAADKKRNWGNDLVYEDFPAVASDIIYEGAGLGDSSGNARPLQAADVFMGFAARRCDNSSGAAGAKKVRAIVEGTLEVEVTGIASEDDYTGAVYMSDDDTFTTTSSGNTQIGKVSRHVSGTKCIVFFQAAHRRSI